MSTWHPFISKMAQIQDKGGRVLNKRFEYADAPQ